MSSEKRFTAESNILEVLESDPGMVEVFRKLGLKCVDCVASEVETLKLAALYHEIDLDRILAELNRAGSGSEKRER